MCGPEIVVDGFTGLVRQLEFDRSASFLLPHRRAVDSISIWRYVLNLEGHHIAAPQLAIDRQIEHGEVASSPWTSNRVLIDQTCFGRSGGFAPQSVCPC